MQAGWTGLFAVERDESAFRTLRHNLLGPTSHFRFDWPDWLPQEPLDVLDMLKEREQELLGLRGTVDMLVGGPPCQGFSAAGKREPSDPRNLLVEAYLELVRLLLPPIVLIENVRGIASDFEDHLRPGEKVNYAKRIVRALSEDYWTSAQMLNAQDFGIPQRRSRLFIIGLRRDIFSEGLDPFSTIEQSKAQLLRQKGLCALPITSKMAISDLEVRPGKKQRYRHDARYEEIVYDRPKTTYQQLLSQNGKIKQPTDLRLANHTPQITYRFQRIIDDCVTNNRLNTSLSSEFRATLGIRKRALRVMDPNRPAPTVTSMPDDLIHYQEPRTLTVRENARLQSFPDWFAFQGNYTTGGHRRRKEVPRFTQVANAVPPLLAEAIGNALIHIMGDCPSSPLCAETASNHT